MFNPWTLELHQYVREDRAAYALRENSQEDDYLTIQVELWAKARDVPDYDERWYKGVAQLILWAMDKFGIPIIFADFDFQIPGSASPTAPQRMTDEEVLQFAGIIGHCHMGRDVDSHWDPGNLDVDRLMKYLLAAGVGVDDMMIIEALQDQTMEWYEALQAKTGSPGGNAAYWGKDYPGNGPNDEEWVTAAPELFSAALTAGVLGPFEVSGGTTDTVARDAAARANTRLDGIVTVVPD